MAVLTDSETGRLRDLAAAWRDARQVKDVATRKMQDAVLTAIDEKGAPRREVAAALGVSPTRIHAIIQDAYRH